MHYEQSLFYYAELNRDVADHSIPKTELRWTALTTVDR
jgi:hypothetical protein